MASGDELPPADASNEAPGSGASALWLLGSGLVGAAVGALLVARGNKRTARGARHRPTERAEEDGEQLLQEIRRTRMPDGKEYVRGTLVAEFDPGQRVSTVHVGFCPPFESLPAVDAEVDGDLSATVKITQILHQGAELEVRLAAPCEEACRVEVQFVATNEASQ